MRLHKNAIVNYANILFILYMNFSQKTIDKTIFMWYNTVQTVFFVKEGVILYVQ